MKNILILEDHPETRQWLVEMIEQAFVKTNIKEAASLAQANQLLEETKFDLALVDLNLPDGTGTDFIKTINKTSPETYVVVATVFDDDEHLFPALEAGAQGYLLKDLSNSDFINALNGIIKGEPPISPVIARKLIGHFNKPLASKIKENQTQLSNRETEILRHIAKGLNRTEAAKLLHISPHTVASHLKKIYNKLNVSSRAEVTLEALRLGLLKT
jgi:DNA-binding NarL/FixJ family response regulator